MKKLFTVLFALALTAGCICARGKARPEVRFNQEGEFRILHLTDLHFVADRPEESEKTFARMDYMVETEKPDFIAITGDVIYGKKPSKALLQSILDKLDSYRLPFCIVYGNHDPEQDMSRAEMSQMIASARYSVNTLDSKGELADVRIPVGSTVNPGSDPLDLYFFDSHQYSKKKQVGGYAWLTLDQIIWMRDRCNAATEANGGNHVPSFAFFHIPLPEFYDAWKLTEDSRKKAGLGLRGEYGGHPKINSGMFTAMLEAGNIIGIFCGHDHDSDYIVPYYGIALAYGRYSGDGTVYNHLPHGARIISVKEGERAFTTWIREDGGRIQYKCLFKDGKVTK